MFPKEDEKFTLSELVDNYSSLFPIKVCVVKGFYSDRGEDSAIAVDELYNFHFVKRAKVLKPVARRKPEKHMLMYLFPSVAGGVH